MQIACEVEKNALNILLMAFSVSSFEIAFVSYGTIKTIKSQRIIWIPLDFRTLASPGMEKKGRDLTRESDDKSPYTHRKTQKARYKHTSAIKNFVYTTIADRLRHGPFDILGGGGAGIFWKKNSLL